MIDFLAGALMLAFLVTTAHFVRFWQRTSDSLFLYFAVAFALLAMNQLAVFMLGVEDERGNYAYVLRVSGFVLILILFGILSKNIMGTRGKRD